MKKLIFYLIISCVMSTNATSQDSISYLALGDSYTIGEQVVENQSWPFQLTSYLNDEGFKVKSPEIIAVTGWRTDELQDSIAVQNYKADQFDLVSLLIGVNNQYQKKPFKQFKVEFEELLKNAILICSHQAKGVFVVGIPDYSLSKYARDEKLKGISSKLKRYNRFIKKMCQRHGVAFYPLQQLSRPLHRKTDMLAEDFLHPSGKQYRIWVDSFKDQVKNQVESF